MPDMAVPRVRSAWRDTCGSRADARCGSWEQRASDDSDGGSGGGGDGESGSGDGLALPIGLGIAGTVVVVGAVVIVLVVRRKKKSDRTYKTVKVQPSDMKVENL